MVPIVVGNMMIFRLAAMLLVLPLILYVSSMDYFSPTINLLIRLIWIDAAISSVIDVLIVVFRAYQKMEYEAVSYFIHDIFTTIIASIMIIYGYGIVPVIIAFILGKIIAFIFASIVMIKKFPKPKYNADITLIKKLIVRSLPFIINGVFLLIIFRIDIVMLARMKDEYITGIYESAYNLIRNLELLSLVFITALYPHISSLYKNNKQQIYTEYKKAFKILFIIVIITHLSLIIFAKPIIQIIYGPSFESAVSLIPILALGGFFLNMGALNIYLLNAMNKEKKNVLFIGLATVINLVLNLILIPEHGYYGAAYAAP